MVTLWRQNFSHFLIQCPVSLVYYEFWSCSVTGRTKIFRSNRPIIKLFRSDQFFLAVSCLFVHLSETHGDSDNAWKRDKTMSVKNRCSAHLKEATFQITKVIPTLPSALPETNIATWKYAIPKSWNLHSTTKTIRENILGFSTGFLSLFFHQNGPPPFNPSLSCASRLPGASFVGISPGHFEAPHLEAKTGLMDVTNLAAPNRGA